MGKRMLNRSLIGAVATIILLSGCADGVNHLSLPGIEGKPGPDISLFDSAYVKSHVIVGKTTAQELTALYGEPGDRSISSDGGEQWDYHPSSTMNESMRKVLGLVANRMPASDYENALNTKSTAIDNIAPKQKNTRLSIHLKNGVVSYYSLS